MVKAYENTNDKWRAFGYQKAIMALRKYPKEITTWEVKLMCNKAVLKILFCFIINFCYDKFSDFIFNVKDI